jgi:hypothetical protein
MLLLDMLASTNAKWTLTHIFDAEDALVECNKKWTNRSTPFTSITTMSSLDDILIAIANIKGLLSI